MWPVEVAVLVAPGPADDPGGRPRTHTGELRLAARVRLCRSTAAVGREDGCGQRRGPLPCALGGPRVPDRHRTPDPELRRRLVCERLGRGSFLRAGVRS